PGTAPAFPRDPISQAEPSETTMSWVPWVHRTGSFGSRSTMSDQLQYLPESAFKMPRAPGATPGQLTEAVWSPGKPASPVTDLSAASTSKSSRSAGSGCVGDQ